MLELRKLDIRPGWWLRATSDRPFIAQITGFDNKYTFSRKWLGSKFLGGACLYEITEWEKPVLLDIRHDGRGYYILHGTDFDNLQLSEVSRGLIARLLAEPLFSSYTFGPGVIRIVDEDLDLDKKLQKETPYVIESPVMPREPAPIARLVADQQRTYNSLLSRMLGTGPLPDQSPEYLIVDMPPPRRKKKAAKSNLPPILEHEKPRKFNLKDD